MDTTAALASIRVGLSQSAVARCCTQALLPVGAGVAAFIVDLHTPNGLLDGLLYVLVILACQWLPNAKSPLYAASGVMLPMILGFLLSPMGVPMWMAVTNKVVAMIIIWIAALVVSRSIQAATNKESALSEIRQQLHAAEHLAHDERTGLSDWLREEISLELAIIDWRLNRFVRAPRCGFDLKSEVLFLRRAVQRARHSAYGKELRLRVSAVEPWNREQSINTVLPMLR